MNRLEIIKDIEKMETRKIEFENTLKDMQSYYFQKAYIGFEIITKDSNKNYNGASLEVNKLIMFEYLKKEIEILGEKIDDKINQLSPKN